MKKINENTNNHTFYFQKNRSKEINEDINFIQ